MERKERNEEEGEGRKNGGGGGGGGGRVESRRDEEKQARAKEFHCAFRMQAIFHQCYKTMKDRRVFENVWRLPALISRPEWR